MRTSENLASASILQSLLLRLTPLRSNDSDDAYDHSLLVAIGLITLPFALLYVAVSYSIAYRAGVILMTACFFLLVAILWAFKATGRFRLCANLYLANCFFVAICGCSFYSGGIRSMVLPWICLVPITSVLLLELSTDTIVWTVLTGLVVIGFGLAALAGVAFPVAYDAGFTDLFNIACVVGLAMILSLIAWTFARNRSEALATVRMALEHLAEARDEAEAANLTKSRFLAAASHDLRQPVQAIALFQSALEATPLDDEQRRISGLLRESTQSLTEILNALLDVLRLDSGTVKAYPEPVPVALLLRKIEAQCSALATAKGLRFRLFQPGDATVALLTDAALLNIVLRNLVDNAIKYTQRGGILIGVRRRGGHALIQVWDTGKGISADKIGTIFDEYVQLDNPHRDSANGLGLGLSIAQRLSDLLGIALRCRSRLGRGSVFELSVPLAAAK
jgi:signal transduction histidine kinase